VTTTAAPPATDRRAAPRSQPALGTVCRLGPAWPRVGLVWNISRTGVSALFGDPPPAGAEVGAVLAADGGEAGLVVTLRVVHVREVATGDYLLGARFVRPLRDDEMAPFVSPPPAARQVLPKKG
jgi:hypothetical protein